jgi:hypothetical protein
MTFTIATGATSLASTTLQGLILPRGSRTPTSVTITAAAASAADATSISVTCSTASTVVRAGTALIFTAPSPGAGAVNRQLAIVSATTTLATTATALPVFALRSAIASTNTASMVVGLIPIFGLQEFGLQGQSTTVDITGTDSGSSTEMQKIRDSREFSINVIERFADIGLGTVIKPLLFSPSLADSEAWLEIVMPQGEIHRGAAMLQNPSKPGNQNEVARLSFTATFQGNSYQYIDGFTYS